MSGICGVVFQQGNVRLNAGDLLPMVRALGPLDVGDGFITHVDAVGMGAQRFFGRLAGVARITSNGCPLMLAIHGNLYNLKEVLPFDREEPSLFARLLRLYLRHGMTFLNGLRGEFALALWDGRDEVLHLATDRFRVHPLFYSHGLDRLLFASRMKGLLAAPFAGGKTVNPEAIVDLVAHSFVPTPKTIFAEVQKLPPGHILTYRRGEVRLFPYWELTFLGSGDCSEGELAQRLKAALSDAVSIRLEGDGVGGRIGTFLSGGVDSSTVTGLLVQSSTHPVKSFSIGFGEEQFNEINYARIAARAFGTEYHEYFVTAKDTYDAIPLLLEAFDEPFANASAVPTYFCAKLAREHGVDVLYAGDGGDELFAGNQRYADQRVFDYYHRVPAWLREPLVKPLVFTMAEWLKLSFSVKGKKYIQRASIPYPFRLSSYSFFKVVPLQELLEDGVLDSVGKDYDPYAPMHAYYFEALARTELDRQLYIDLKLAISDNDLFKVVRMTEASGIAARFPFLDHRLAELASTIPAAIKMRGRRLRSFFKKTYADLLPLEIRAKKKHGFGLPIPVWLLTDKRLNEMLHDLVLSPRSVQRGYFRKKRLEQLVADHRIDKTSFYGTVLWNLMTLELWHRRYLD